MKHTTNAIFLRNVRSADLCKPAIFTLKKLYILFVVIYDVTSFKFSLKECFPWFRGFLR